MESSHEEDDADANDDKFDTSVLSNVKKQKYFSASQVKSEYLMERNPLVGEIQKRELEGKRAIL